jgi:hypothetical protein
MGIVFAVLFGPLVWAAHLAVLYGAHASVCAAASTVGGGGPPSPIVPALALATAIALGLVSLPLAFPKRFDGFLSARAEDEKRFLLSLMRWLAGLSVVAVLANGVALLTVPPC